MVWNMNMIPYNCLMMYFKNNWNAGPFFLLHGYIYIDFQTCMNIYIRLYFYVGGGRAGGKGVCGRLMSPAHLFQQLEQFLERRPKCSCKFQNMNLADQNGMEYEYDTL
jgi:hypothetical protein